MRPKHYHADTLVTLLKNRKIASMQELKEALGTGANITVLRKLKELEYLSSYSHRGQYYTLRRIPEFDEFGLWSFRSVWFSERGTLLATAMDMVAESDMGLFATELESLLHVEVKGSLIKLVHQGKTYREKVGGRYLYCSSSPEKKREQLRARKLHLAQDPVERQTRVPVVMPDELKAAIILFFSLLDERQRRLYAGLESLKIGHGGDYRIAEILGLDRGTVARGRQELLARDVDVDRVRRLGGGRKLEEKKLRRSSAASKKS